MTLNYKSILNYFINRRTNESAESCNAKIKVKTNLQYNLHKY
nr:hypothetical protein [uncultured Aquimarina sp.]